ncbi:cytochrome c3 family protein [Desulfurivibrio sp. D14AmB]|uniref:cytochrome c3 family protein n=1 Tax=Desulfurivibrio sp. D14AmB TaxID=3374370 RepID=UPI00376F08D3
MGGGWAAALLLGVGLLLVAGSSQAGVGNSCFDCHTMHHSEAGSTLLLISGCVGCHSHDGPETVVEMGAARIPIVYNTGGPPDAMLAGGNFHWVATMGDKYGHNVLGVSGPDQYLATAPGGSAGCANSCHQSLARAEVHVPGGTLALDDGCQSCHGSVKHHRPERPPGTPADAETGWYRFLKAPELHGFAANKPGVGGIGTNDWERHADSSHHNIYLADDGSGNPTQRSLSRFCSGCHQDFHTKVGGATPWLRHPTNYAIPDRGEFAAVIGAPYNPQVPVAKPDLYSHRPEVVEPGDQVACVSCHRAHGSPYPDMLRWDYSQMRAHQGGEAAGNGCFFCHTAKDA